MSTVESSTDAITYDRIYIGGEWVEPSSNEVLDAISPITEEIIGRVPAGQPADIDRAVTAARRAFDDGPWPRMSGVERADAIMRLHAELSKRADDVNRTFTAEIGGPAGLAGAFIDMALASLESVATIAREFPFEEDRDVDGSSGRLVREPIGVVASIVPWNGPVTSSCLKLGPALAAGCTVVLKPSPEGALGQMILADAVDAADFPEGVVSIVAAGRETGEYLVTHPGIDKVAFTGSTAAGKRIMSLCGERVRNVTLELGGKSAAVIADDIDFDKVIPYLVPGGMANSGQVCAALTRVLVPRERQDELIDAITAFLGGWKVGDPTEPDTAMGPLVAERQRDRVEEYIQIGIDEGARLVYGGRRPEGLDRGWYVEPTVFADVDNKMRIAQEEIFGPVISVIPFDCVDHAVDLANDSPYGLSGAVFARDTELAENIARRIRTGQVSINTFNICLTEPFGGYKQSGLGREGGPEGVTAYLETKLLQGL
ncbi:aldehyde dehydrogenase [Rhodococcus sp. NCIMB 12038]|uniref:aldehyde dehydrogenase n=1 Tax=Rhodococcus sp. NCIMB 12038 TaxID=933800 RepID=UPI000B3C2CFD|nr:aldehyde dehydrogenase [Rhodococcus sp. NCIMB 12038]OUS92106.1 aldehyde dehydrogenase [Rhodococcus sp. NCIMB 12038]